MVLIAFIASILALVYGGRAVPEGPCGAARTDRANEIAAAIAEGASAPS